MEVMSRGKCDQGLTWMPRLRRNWLMVSLSTMRNSRPNLSRISSCHWTWREDGQTISDGANTVAQDHFLHTNARLDGLAQTNVVGDQQIDPRHGERPDHRIELVFIHLDAAAEWRLQCSVVGLGDSAPAHGIEEGLQALGMVESVGIGQRGFLMHRSAWFHLPDDLKFLAETVVFDGGELDQVA